MTTRAATLMILCQAWLTLSSAGCGLHAAGEEAPSYDNRRGLGGEAGSNPLDAGSAADGSAASISVLTRNYDNQRTGTNPHESQLLPTTVTANRFGRLFQLPVDDEIYAQPLYRADLTIDAHRHNVLFVATNSNTIYAFDADLPGPPLWQRSFNGAGVPGSKSDVGQSCQPYLDFTGHIGIVGTPVIDAATATMYFVTRTTQDLSIVQRLHAIDIATGFERLGSPREIAARVPGAGAGSEGGMLAFNPRTQNQRAALGLSDGVVYVAWASFCDTGQFHGWAMAFDASTLATVGVTNLTPEGSQGGVWMGGGGPAFDKDGNAYLVTGNGTWDGKVNFGQTLLKLAPKTLRRLDFFTPSNVDALNRTDLDFGGAGPSLLPGTSLLVAGSKEGKVYLLDSGNLGQQAQDDRQIPQVLHAVDDTVRPRTSHHLHGTNVVWNGPAGLSLFVWGENDFLRAFRFDAARRTFAMPAAATSTTLLPAGMPGGMMTLSSNGTRAGTGVLWVTAPRLGDANRGTVPGRLRAFDAESLRLLWDSSAPSDDMLTLAKFNPPVVANGKVYVASFSKVVSVYGLRPPVNRPAPAPISGEVVMLQNPAAHRCLDADPASGALGVADCEGAGQQVWLLGSGDGEQWELQQDATAQCLSAPEETVGEGLVLAPCDGSAAQRFTFGDLEGNLTIRTVPGGLCVDVNPRAGGPGPTALLADCDGGDGQPLALLPPRLRNYNADLCVDGATASGQDGPGPVRLWTCNGSTVQRWQTDGNSDGTVTIRRGTTNVCLSAPPGAAAQGQAIGQRPCDGLPGQAWVNEAISGGSQLRLPGTDLCLDVLASSSEAGSPLQLWPCNRSDAQRFGF